MTTENSPTEESRPTPEYRPLEARIAPSFAFQAARASWVAWLIGIVSAMVLREYSKESPTNAVTVAAFVGFVLVLGFVLSLLSLGNLRKRNWRWGILVQALIGLLLNGMSLSGMTWAMVGPRNQVTPEQAAQQARQFVEEAVFDHPGWVAMANAPDAFFAVMSIDDSADLAQQKYSPFDEGFSFVMISVINHSATKVLSIDRSSIRFAGPEGKVIRCLPDDEVLKAAKPGKRAVAARFFGPLEVPPGASVDGRFVCFPRGTVFAGATSLLMNISGEPWEIEGQFLTGRQKRELLRPETPPEQE